MTTPRFLLCCGAVLSCLLAPLTVDAAVSYARDVWPILKENCVRCHRAPYVKEGKLVETQRGAAIGYTFLGIQRW